MGKKTTVEKEAAEKQATRKKAAKASVAGKGKGSKAAAKRPRGRAATFSPPAPVIKITDGALHVEITGEGLFTDPDPTILAALVADNKGLFFDLKRLSEIVAKDPTKANSMADLLTALSALGVAVICKAKDG